MDFEFDPQESELNKEKDGIDFFEAQSLWDDPNLIWDDPNLIEIPAKTVDEARSLIIGKINNKHWSSVITYRSNKIRIISVRRARFEEIKVYES
ncbi:MAG: BrnT family toxin [bacterium]